MFCKKGVFRNFAKFTGKHQCQSLFFNKVASGLQFPRTPFLNNTSGGCFCSGLLMWEFFLWSLRPLSRGEVYGDKKYYDRSEAYSEPCRISTMKVFFENSWRLKVVNYFHWKIHLRYLTWFWIRLCKWSRKVAKYIFLFITGLLFLENW